jgi:hypothetical protein
MAARRRPQLGEAAEHRELFRGRIRGEDVQCAGDSLGRGHLGEVRHPDEERVVEALGVGRPGVGYGGVRRKRRAAALL